MVKAYEKIWLHDSQIRAVCPFLLAGDFWAADGWPYLVKGQAQPVFNATQALRKRTLKSDDTPDEAFEVVWNGPSAGCSKGAHPLTPEAYGIKVNAEQAFNGSQITCL